MRKILSILAVIALLSTPVLAQTVVTATNPAFSWTGKQGDQSGYNWSATVTNPARRTVTANVTLQLVDASGNVVAADSKTVVLERESELQVGGDSTISYADARRATQYRITVEGVEN